MVKLLKQLLAAVRRAERFLGPDDDWVEDGRRIIYEAANPLFTALLNRPTIRKKGTADYICTVGVDSDAVEEVLHRGDYQRNLLSTRKYREHHSGGKQWAVGSWVLDAANTDWQHHVYLFPSPDGGCDIYGHREATVRNPKEHEDGWRAPGDPRGRVRGLLSEAGVSHGKRQP